MNKPEEQVKKLIDEVTSFINDLKYWPSIDTSLGIVVWALVSKSLVVGRAICVLVEQGFYEEAFGLSRTVLDLFFTVHYITNKDSENRASRFAHFGAKDKVEWIKIITKHYPGEDLSNVPNLDAVLKEAKKYPSPHRWTGMGDQTKKMAIEDDEYEKDANGDPVNFEFDYEVIFKWTSHFVHPTVIALRSHATDRPGLFRVHAFKEQGNNFKSLALFFVVTNINKIMICTLRKFEIDFPPALSQEFGDVMNSLR